MAITPRPYIWKESQLINDTADETGATFHFYDVNAQIIYPNSGLKYKYDEIPEGHWEDLELSDEETLENTNYTFIKGDHPATGSLYMIGLHRTASKDTLYLFRYDYERDVSDLVESATLTLQGDNPITQIAANIKNVKDSLFTMDSSLFAPSSKLLIGIGYGKSLINTLAIGYTDEVSWRHGAKTVSISGRNTVGYFLNSQTFDNEIEYNDMAINVLTSIFERFGVTNYEIDPLGTANVQITVAASDTGLKVIQTISDILSDVINRKQWDIEELYDGKIIVGFDEFRGELNPRSEYIFNGKSDVFESSLNRSIDGSYTHVRCTGTDANKKDLRPVTKDVTPNRYWKPGEHKTYHAPKVDGTTQEKLEKYAEILAGQLSRAGKTATYETTLRPQLVIGDVAEIAGEDGEDNKILGIITEIKHSFGERGYLTRFTAASGGEITLINNRAYTKSKSINGSNRSKRVSDFIPKEYEASAGGISTPEPTLVRRGWAHFDGSDYIRLPFFVEENYQVKVVFEIDQNAMAGSSVNMGIIGTPSGMDYQCLVAVRSGYYTTSSGTTPVGFTGSTSGKHGFYVNEISGDYPRVMFGDDEVTRYFPTTLQTMSMMMLGWCAGADEKFTGNIYEYKIIDNNTGSVLMSLIPAEYISSDHVQLDAGLYDEVGKKFYKYEGMEVFGYM